ncbi:BCCT family transporter [Spartinivicinus poritis]|uniref:BCCT family transporter n=1 Tax=Spartinivicinus poritis TaxID=2994640 RepID=A0ABT5UHV8_9GAMM|nr:BCCT family transporter [Spartinivicinus sp. A2-2]MDE1465938.1 BCCT family transporter [Spartinivicinus sp. A2-2]
MVSTQGFFRGTDPTSSTISFLTILLFVISGVLITDTVAGWFGAMSSWILSYFKWYYIGLVACLLFFCFWLIASPYGQIKLGENDEQPEYSYFAWFAMLFSAGMGIGLVFWSIAEPIYHFQGNPFTSEPLTPEAAEIAMRLTYFHWGLHPWAIYVVVGLSLSFFSYRKKLPLAIRSALHPLIGDRLYGPWGHLVDVLAVFATVFGVATSMGLGISQMNAGLHHMFGVDISTTNQLFLITIVTAIATLSTVTGVGKGIKWLSSINLWLTFIIMGFLLLYGPTRYLLNSFLQSTGDYLANVIPLSLWTDAESQSSGWQNSWTAFYWGWWIAWAPFVGMFIARISRGRTIREFVIGVLLVPTLLGFIWLTLFGSTALSLELFHQVKNEAGEMVAAVGQAGIVDAVKADVTSALYTTLETLDNGTVGWTATFVATLLIATYFITSADSGTLVVATILSHGNPNPATIHRVIWGVGEGAVAAVLLLAGGLKALQTASINVALPFSLVIIVMMWGLVKALKAEHQQTLIQPLSVKSS